MQLGAGTGPGQHGDRLGGAVESGQGPQSLAWVLSSRGAGQGIHRDAL